MSKKTKRAGYGGWGVWPRAAAGSSLVHAVLLAGLWVAREPAPAPAEAAQVVVELKADPTVGEALAAAALPDPPPAARDEAVVPRPLDAPEADRDNAVAKTVGPREGDGRERAAPAPDRGVDGGRLPGLATRRDLSTLQSRVADAETDAQSARLRTSRRSASPQAVRREQKTGTGDSVRTSEATRAVSAAAPEPPPGASELPPDVAGPAAGAKVAERTQPLDLPRASDHPDSDRGVGPLDAERGARMFDVEARGRAADDQDRRAVSNESHPGITDFSHAGVAASVDARQGRGPGDAPGAVSRPSNGAAPAVYGARNPQELAAEAAERAREREYNRYRQGIAQRLGSVLKFPRNLLVHLEQGEAVVTFVVKPDGSLLERPKLIKSAGFQEFDAEAVDAVLRAAPFARRADKADMIITVPVTWENPLVR
jgi:TonB family protein